jgi:hypothetical protein
MLLASWNVVVEWLTLLLNIRGSRVQISALRPAILIEICCVLPGECRDSILNLGHDRFLPYPLQFIIHLSPFHSALYLDWVTAKASLNKIQIQILPYNAIKKEGNYYFIQINICTHMTQVVTLICGAKTTWNVATYTTEKWRDGLINKERRFT